jgi:hypothetical protein
MAWSLHRQQQQRGAQLGDKPPKEATRDRSAQDHEQAGGEPQAGESPASPIEHREQDNTPSAPDPRVDWDEVVQPQRQQRQGKPYDDLPLPEGK